MRARLAPFAAVLLAAVGGCHGAIDRDPGAAVTDPGAPPLGNAPSPDSGAPLPDAGTTPPPAPDAGVDYSGVDPLSNVGQVERLNTETNFNFTEGPLWIAARGVVLFTDIPENRIIEFTPPDTFKLDYQAPSGNANGLALDPQGRLLACEHGNRRVSRTEAGGSVVTVAGAFEGKRLNSPNDLVVRSDGTIYFSDPPYGVDASARELDFQGVFRIAPDGSIHLVSRDMNRPNGLALSPDERTLYVSDSQEGYVRVHAVNADGTVGPPRKLFDTGGGGDGMAMDLAGNLYVTTNGGVKVYRGDGTPRGTIAIPRFAPTNVSFGGDDGRALYVTAGQALYRIRLNVPGLP